MNREEVKKLITIWRQQPVLFSKYALGFVPDQWQEQTLKDVRDNDQVAIASGHGVGKTSVVAVTIIWFLVCFENAKVVCTAPTKQQLTDVVWAELAKWLESAKVKHFLKWTKTKISVVGSEER